MEIYIEGQQFVCVFVFVFIQCIGTKRNDIYKYSDLNSVYVTCPLIIQATIDDHQSLVHENFGINVRFVFLIHK